MHTVVDPQLPNSQTLAYSMYTYHIVISRTRLLNSSLCLKHDVTERSLLRRLDSHRLFGIVRSMHMSWAEGEQPNWLIRERVSQTDTRGV